MTVWAVCPRCRGEGHHSNPAIDGHGITEDEMYELGEDFREDYMNGEYDIVCSRCGGRRVVAVCPVQGCTSALAFYDDTESGSYFTHQVEFTHCQEHLDEDERENEQGMAEIAAESAAERRMGA